MSFVRRSKEKDQLDIQMKYIFWNTHKNKDINIYLEKMILEYQPDFIGLVEYSSNGKSLVDRLSAHGSKYTYITSIASRCHIIWRGDIKEIVHCSDHSYYTVKKVPFGKVWQIIVVVHFPSKRNYDPETNAEIFRDIKKDINKAKEIGSINKVIIMGDFNMNPFDTPMIEATSIQAISSREIVLRKKNRKYKEKERELYYNPMWNFLGDEKKPTGSFYYATSENKAMYWNTLDQFIVNAELADCVLLDKIKFIDVVNGEVLMDEKGKPLVSDHFALYFEIGEK